MSEVNEKILQRFVGYSHKRDEYQLSEIFRILSHGLIYLYSLVTISVLVSLLWDVYTERLSIATPLLFITQIYIFLYTTLKGNKIRKIDNAEYIETYNENQYTRMLTTLKRQMVYFASIGITMDLVLTVYFNSITDHIPLQLTLFEIILAVFNILILVTIFYFVSKMMIDKKY